MEGKSFGQTNCDGQHYTPELAIALKESYLKISQAKKNALRNLYITEWEEKGHTNIEYDIILHSKKETLDEVVGFYLTLRNIRRRKLFIGPPELSKAARMLNAQHVVVHPTRSFKDWDLTCQDILNNGSYDCILLYSCGMTSKTFISNFLSEYLTQIDIGSGLDPLFKGHKTREPQINPSILERYYRNVL